MAYGKVSFVSLIPQSQQILEQNTLILGTLTDVSAWYVKASNSVNFPVFATTTAEDVAFGTAAAGEDPNTGSDSFNVTNMLIQSFNLDRHIDHQNILDSKELKLQGIIAAIGRGASNKAVVAMVAGAAAANDVTKAASNNSLVQNLMTMKSKLRSAGVRGQLYALLTAADMLALEIELVDKRRFESDTKGIVEVVAGIMVVDGSDIDDAGFTHSLVYSKDCIAYAWGPEYIYETLPIAGAKEFNEVSRAFACKAMQSGKFISKLLPSA